MTYVLGEGIEVEAFESESIAYHPNGCVYVANETAGIILKTIDDGGSIDDAVAVVCSRYDISESRAKSDADLCLKALISKEVVVVKDE